MTTKKSTRNAKAPKAAKAATPKAEKKVRAPAAAKPPKAPKAPREPKVAKVKPEPKERDARLPPVGTVITKTDRDGKVRAECKVVSDGFEYLGEHYKSISGAAKAACEKLGLNTSVDGYIWWGLQKPARPVADPVDAMTAALARFVERAKAILAAAADENVRTKLRASVTEAAAGIVG